LFAGGVLEAVEELSTPCNGFKQYSPKIEEYLESFQLHVTDSLDIEYYS
jgi:hypothetical protein